MSNKEVTGNLSQYARHVPKGSVIMVQGDPGNICYIVHSGQFAIIVNQKEVNVIGPGAIVGEMALFTQEPRTATVMATEDSVVIQIESNRFKTMLQEIPQLDYLLIKVLIKRIKDANAKCVNLMQKLDGIKESRSKREHSLYLRIQELEESLEVVIDSLKFLTKQQLERDGSETGSLSILAEIEETDIEKMLESIKL